MADLKNLGPVTSPTSFIDRQSGLNILLFGLFIRIFTLFVIQYYERINNIPLTDVDYFVFTDAAAFVKQGLSPYLRHTYRYTPFLAWLLTPTSYFPLFGKIVFILVDWGSAVIIYNKFGKIPTSLYLFNPLTIGIAARGNAESLIVFVCLLALTNVDTWCVGGPLLALAVHLKVYPAPWALTIWLHLAARVGRSFKWPMRHINDVLPWSLRGILLGLASLASFCLLTLVAYAHYGTDYLEHAHLHHLSRQDTRHNFSIWFLSFYLYDGESMYSSVCFLSQATLFIIIAIKYSNEIYFAAFLQAFVFVTFNKVITSQYFIWYISLLPTIWNNIKHVNKWHAALWTVIWFLGQGVWLLPAYYLEILGINSLLFVHTAAVAHLTINLMFITFIIRNFQPTKAKMS